MSRARARCNHLSASAGTRYTLLDSMPAEFFRWLVNSPWSHAMNAYEWVFPAVQSCHFIGFALSIGTIAITDLRMLGFGMRRQTPAELAADFGRWTLAGIAVMLVTGFLMFSTDAVGYHNNPSFQFKMACLTAALLFYFTLHRRALRPGVPPILEKAAAVTSLLLWTGVVAGGRMIAFV
jgi:hypothetical protein